MTLVGCQMKLGQDDGTAGGKITAEVISVKAGLHVRRKHSA